MELFYKSVIQTARALWKFEDIKFQFYGFENFPAQGGAVIPINHTGYMDFTFAGIPAYVISRRRVRFMAHKGAFENKFSGPMLRAMKHIPVDREHAKETGQENAAIQLASERVQQGELVGIFPEGHISRSFELADFKTGAARIALQANAPLVPIVIWGSQRIWTPGFPKHLGRNHYPIALAVGKPIYPVGDPKTITSQYKAEMQKLLDMVQANYPEHPAGAYWVPARLGGGAPTLAAATEAYAIEKLKRKQRKS